MSLTAGTRVGEYEIIAAIGAGGMGEVYRARDSRLDRQVAIKVLPEAMVHDKDRLARFEREAKLLAALNHPHIAHVYGFESSGSTGAIVMELVEGPTLDERLAAGPLDARDAIHIARQLTDALETAHELGIIHRDLKPSNIKLQLRGGSAVRRSGDRQASAVDLSDCIVKVLDFGLAKSLESSGAAADALSSPTLTARATELGTILGTAAYMAPEQARGRPVDRRADVWSFGVVLYEMLSGKRLFHGEDVSDTLAAVLRQPIDLAELPPTTPPEIRVLLARCLEREPRQRLRDIGEARIVLERVASGRAGASQAADQPASSSLTSRRRSPLPWLAAAAVVALGLTTLTLWNARGSTGALPEVTWVSTNIGLPGELLVDNSPAAVLSPDGRAMVLRIMRDKVARLYARRLDQLTPVELAGTENASNPFFSPDGRQIGFFAATGLKVMPLAGGAVTPLTDAPAGRGAAWLPGGDILFQSSLFPDSPLLRVPSTGGSKAAGSTLAADEVTHRWPQVLPGNRVIYSSHTSVAGWDQALIRVATQPGDAGKVVLRGGYHARYVPSGHLLYVHAHTLYAIRFDLDRLETTSAPVAMIENIVATPQNGAAQYSIADNGTLAYVPGHAAAGANRIAWLRPDGTVEQLAVNIGAWGNPRFSPDGGRIAMQVTYGNHDQIAIYDIKSARLTQLTFDAANHRNPSWMPDGKSIIYVADTNGSGPTNIYWRLAHGSGPPQRLTTSAKAQTQTVVHPNGRMVVYTEEGDSPANHQLTVLPLDGTPESGWKPGQPRALTASGSFAGLGSFSPDGRFVAYMSSEEGPFQVFVKALDGDGRSWRVSGAGGAHPLWSSNNRELIYNEAEQLMSVPYRIAGNTFQPEAARLWTKASFAAGGPIRTFDLHPDGKRMIAANPDALGPAPHQTVVLVFNFFEELRRRVSATR